MLWLTGFMTIVVWLRYRQLTAKERNFRHTAKVTPPITPKEWHDHAEYKYLRGVRWDKERTAWETSLENHLNTCESNWRKQGWEPNSSYIQDYGRVVKFMVPYK